MATHVMVALQKKIYEILSQDLEITSDYGCDVYDSVPDNSDLPYLVIGDDEYDDFSTHTNDSFKVTITIHVWTEGEGKKLNKEILSRVYELLHEADLDLTGQKTISMRAGLTNVLLDPDGRTYHGVIKFNLLLGG